MARNPGGTDPSPHPLVITMTLRLRPIGTQLIGGSGRPRVTITRRARLILARPCVNRVTDLLMFRLSKHLQLSRLRRTQCPLLNRSGLLLSLLRPSM